MTTQAVDPAKVEEFAGRVTAILNGASLATMFGIGHQTGLFDAMAGLTWATSEAIAQTAGLNERYVRKGLGSLVIGRVVEYDPAQRTYRLPSEHAALLTPCGRPGQPRPLRARPCGVGDGDGARVPAQPLHRLRLL